MAARHDSSKAGKQKRAGTACNYCHSRKIRCDVQQRGVPCSNCVDHQSSACTIRQRKNARETRPERSPDKAWPDVDQIEPVPSAVSPPQLQHEFSFDGVDQQLGWSPWTASTSVDFSNLTDLEDIFAFTDWASLPGLPQPAASDFQSLQGDPNAVPTPPSELARFSHIGFAWAPTLNATDLHFLQSQDCFEIPQTQTLREIFRYYFQFIHPNLPVIDEHRFESMWTEEDYRLEGFSFLVFRAMLFASVHFLDEGSLSVLGYATKREARLAYYRRTKLILDFEAEADPVANAQACLLLTYYAPPHNSLRVNGYWLMNAARFARIAEADTYHLTRDPAKARTLKRLWWGVLFRDRFLSLGLRWGPQVELSPVFENEENFLSPEDFEPELGKSKIHDFATQIRLANIANSTCSLVCRLTPALQVLYRHETVAKRVISTADCPQATIAEVRRCLDGLQEWHERNIPIFPIPVSLDDTHESVCIFANLLFCYYASAVFALHSYCILVHETVPTARDLISLEACQEGSLQALKDIDRRTQELVQTRLTRFLPITVSALMALPFLLHAINVAAVRGTEGEAMETRKLDVFTRILQSQRQNFDGADFCIEILTNIVAYLQNDDKFVEWISAWRDGRESHGTSSSQSHEIKQQEKVKLNWVSLIRRQPRLYLRLLLHLDYALCNGSVPGEDDLPLELLRNGNKEHGTSA